MIRNETTEAAANNQTKFCKYCGEKVPYDAVVCASCGRQIEELKSQNAAPQNIVITNTNTNTNRNGNFGKPKNKWLAFVLCLFLGWLGVHRFYEGKIISGIVYFLTLGLLGVGILIDLVALLFKPNPYYV